MAAANPRKQTKLPEKVDRPMFPQALLLVVLVVIAYLPALRGAFIWDDDAHLTENACITGPLGFTGIWASSSAVYYPLVLTSFWVQHALWGLSPLPYHLVNILVHAQCAVVLWRVLVKLKIPGAWLGAALWALHPVQVESVAWVTELKNTQSCLFYLLCILFFLKWREQAATVPRFRWVTGYLVVLLFAAFAILSKASTVMLPVVLGLCAWWQDRSWRWRNVLSLLPFFAVSAAASGWTIWEQKYHSGALGAEWAQTLAERLVTAGKIVWFYLEKLAWPQPLIFIYPRWEITASPPSAFLPLLLVGVGLAVLWWYRAERCRPVFLAFAYFLVSLFPVLDFFNVYFFRYSYVGDHFQYLASIGPLALAGAAIVGGAGLLKTDKWWLNRVLPGVLLVIFSVMTWQHSQVFRSNETLWLDTVNKNPGAWLGHNNLGIELLGRGEHAEAIARFNETLRLHPRYPEAHGNLGNALAELGQGDAAIAQYRLALEYAPEHAGFHDALGLTLLQRGDVAEAIEHFRASLHFKPNVAETHDHLASALAMQGNFDEAVTHFEESLRLNPNRVKGHMNYGSALATHGQLQAALAQFTEALRLEPGNAAAHTKLAMVLVKLERPAEAIQHLREALRIDPNFAPARQQLQALGFAPAP